MFFDYKPPKQQVDWEGKPMKPIVEPDEGEWRRIERKIYSRWWRAAHNLVAHPMMAIYRPLGEWFHEYTAKKMYQPKENKKAIKTDKD